MMWSLFLSTSVLADDCSGRVGCEACINGVQTFGTGAHFNCVYYEGSSAADGGECMDASAIWSVLGQDGWSNVKKTAFTQCPASGSRSVSDHKAARSLNFKPARSFTPAHSQGDMAARQLIGEILSLARSTALPRDTDGCKDRQSPGFCASLEKMGFCAHDPTSICNAECSEHVNDICAGTCKACDQEEPAAERGAHFGSPTMARSTRDSVSRLMHGLQRSNQKTSFEEMARSFLAAAEAKQRGVHEKPEFQW